MKNINIDREMELFIEAACGVGERPSDTGCTPKGGGGAPKPKFKAPKFKMPKFKAPTLADLEKKRKEKEKKKNRPDRKPNVVDGVDVIRDKEDEQHFMDDFLLKGDGGVDMEEHDKKMTEQWQEQQKKRTPAERKQIKEDIASWKQLGGFEAQERAVEDGTHTREEIQERNERISEISHTTITKVDKPIERGISVPNDVAEQILADFEEGEMAEIPDESGHGSSGFSTSAETARGFADVDDENPEQTSIVFRIEPNSNGEVRGAFIDGEGEDFQGEGEITRSSKSKAKVRKVERVRLPSGKMVVTVILTEPNDLSEVVVKEEEGKVNMISKKYLEGPVNPKPKKVKKKMKKENSLVAKLVNPILKEHKLPLLKEETKIKKVVGIYGGRYQPFGPHHYKTYKWLKSKVDDAYITTSNIKKPPRHPMNFSEKVRHMVKMGVPKNRIVKAKSPLKAEEVLKKYDSETTAVIYIFGEKDAGRLSGGKKKDGSPAYFQNYKKNKRNLKGYEEHGYFMTAPHVSVKVGGKEVSGTVMRDLLGSPKIEDKERPKLFKQAFGYFDKGVYNMMTNKFRKLYEVFEQFIIDNDISKIIKESSGIAKSIPQISDEGMYDFFNDFSDYKRITPLWAEQHGWELVNYVLGDGAKNPLFDLDLKEQGASDVDTSTVTYGRTINQHRKNTASADDPFPKYEKRQGIINKALGWKIIKFMYKDDDKVKIKQTKPSINKNLVKRAIKNKNLGNLNKLQEGKMLNEGKLIAARNKGHLKNKGETALDINAMKSKFEGRGDISDAFVFAMEDLQKAIKSLSVKQRNKIFMNGKAFMNLEVMWPKSANVIDYDKAEIVFHGALEYDDDGNVVGEVKGSARMLAGMIKQVNQNVQKNYNIGKPNFLTVPKTQNFEGKKSSYLSRLNKLQKEYGLKDNDTLGKYHQSYWEEFIFNAAKQFGFTIPATKLKKLTKRWAFFDKSYKVPMIRKDFKKQPEFLDWVLTTDKQDHARMVKENMKPFEILFFDVGAEIMKNVSGWLAASPDAAVQGIKKKLDKAIKDVRSKKDLKKLNRLKIQLDRLNAIGGLEAVVPSEGLVFKYKGKTYKFTGAFAPINQITGLMTF